MYCASVIWVKEKVHVCFKLKPVWRLRAQFFILLKILLHFSTYLITKLINKGTNYRPAEWLLFFYRLTYHYSSMEFSQALLTTQNFLSCCVVELVVEDDVHEELESDSSWTFFSSVIFALMCRESISQAFLYVLHWSKAYLLAYLPN